MEYTCSILSVYRDKFRTVHSPKTLCHRRTYVYIYGTGERRKVINEQVRRTCDDDVDGAARIAGHVAGGARVLARRLRITLAQLDEELVSVDADLHLVVRLERLAVFEPRHAQLRACKSSPPPPQPFYGPFSGTAPVSRCQKRTSGLHGARED